VRRLEDLASSPPWTERASRSVDDLARARVRHDVKRLAGRVERAVAVDDPGRRAEALHDVRKAAKRVRYAAEPLVATYGRPAVRFVKAVKKAASALGDHHDAVVADQVLRDLGDAATSAGENAFTFGVLRERQAAQAAEEEQRFEDAWRRARRRKVRRWLR
jgi:CHAD domain-containing protein